MLLTTMLLAACTPSQKVTSTWINREVLPTVKRPYHSVLILTLTENVHAKNTIEENMAKIIKARGQKAMKSSDVFIPKMSDNSEASQNLIRLAIRKTGCDALFTMALLDVKKVDTFHPGTVYSPMGYGYYGNYAAYYGNYYPMLSDPSYYTTDKTYYVESNFYDIATGQLLYSVQSSAYNPSSLDNWFKDYSRLLLDQLNKDELVVKTRK
jgi:hypothetical protein